MGGRTERKATRLHRTSVVVLLLVVISALVSFNVARSVRDDNERRLLDVQADQMTGLVQSLGSQYQATVASASVVAQRSHGDPAELAAFITASKQQGVWLTLHRGPDGITAAPVLDGGPASQLAANRNPAVDALLGRAFDGGFEIVGMFGTGLNRSIGLAAGVPGIPGDDIAYVEFSLVQAATTPSTQDATSYGEGLGDLYLALYIGDVAPQNFIFATAKDVPGRHVVRTMSFGSQSVSLVVAATHSLTGDLSTWMPWIFLALGLLGGPLFFVITELTLRRRDTAIAVAVELSDKNHALDRALTERDDADRAREALENELRQSQRLEAVGQLAGGIAHDFNNLLAAIQGYADLAVEDLEGHPVKEDIEEIRKAARRGASLTRQLLLFSRHERTEPEAVDVNHVLSDLERLLQRTLGEEIDLRTDLGEHLPNVVVDGGELEQVLMNLVVNARDAIVGAGTITIHTDTLEVVAGDLTSPSVTPGTYVRIRVVDDGNGVPPEIAERLFEPFFTTKERGRGTGLGLSSVYGIVQRSGGHVSFSSEPGRGTTFTILLPAATHDVSTEDLAPTREHVPATSGATILLVEDEDAVRHVATTILERHGHRVLQASSGVEALEEFMGIDFDVLVTDVIMPGGVSGKELADRLRLQRPSLPVVFLSGYSEDVWRDRLDADEIPVVVEKPFSADALAEAVAHALAGMKAARA